MQDRNGTQRTALRAPDTGHTGFLYFEGSHCEPRVCSSQSRFGSLPGTSLIEQAQSGHTMTVVSLPSASEENRKVALKRFSLEFVTKTQPDLVANGY